MTILRIQLEKARGIHLSMSYPGDLACELLPAQAVVTSNRWWWVGGGGASAVAAALVLSFTLVSKNPDPWRPAVQKPLITLGEIRSAVPINMASDLHGLPFDSRYRMVGQGSDSPAFVPGKLPEAVFPALGVGMPTTTQQSSDFPTGAHLTTPPAIRKH